MEQSPKLRLGTRRSKLAQWQARWVAQCLRESGCEVELVLVQTLGDQSAAPLDRLGGAGVFTKELQHSLLTHEIDLAVHSLKDLPTLPVAGLMIAAVPRRDGAQDVLVSREGSRLDELRSQSRVGTSSPRRRAQLLFFRRDLDIVSIRGNVDTRLEKLDAGQFDAIVLAEAGLERLGFAGRMTQRLTPEICLPAPAQGALAVEIRADDGDTHRLVGPLNDPMIEAATSAERSFLAAIEAGCSSPAAAWCRYVSEDEIRLDVAALDKEGRTKITEVVRGSPAEAVALGHRAADVLLAKGAAALL